jgi:hypothetical protein
MAERWLWTPQAARQDLATGNAVGFAVQAAGHPGELEKVPDFSMA